MAEGGNGKQDVNEMFLKMGEKLGWFQHKNISSTLQTLSNSTKKKTTKSRRARQKQGGTPKPPCVANDDTDGPALKPQETEKDGPSSSRKKKQQLQLPQKPLSKPETEEKPDTNCDSSTTGPKRSNFLSCFSDDSDTGVSNDAGHCTVDSYKQVLVMSSDSDESVSNVADHIMGSNHKQTLTISSDSDENLAENDPAFVSCVGESPLGNNSTIHAQKGNKTDLLSPRITSTGHQKIRLKSESPDYDETVINSCLSAASFSIDLESLGEPLVESTRIHRRSSITYRHLIGSPEDEETTDSDSNGSLFKTCIAEPSDDSNNASITPDNSFKLLDIHSAKTETVLNGPKAMNTNFDLANHLNKLKIASNENQADNEDVEGDICTGNIEGDSYEVVDAATQTEDCDIDPGDLSVDDGNMNCDSTPETEDTINYMSVDTSDFKQGDKAALQVRSKSKSMSMHSAISIHASDENNASILDQSDGSEIEVIDVAVQTDDLMNDSPVDSSTDSSDTAERPTASSGFVKRKAVTPCNTSESENACNNSELEDSCHKSISKDAGHNSISGDIHCNSNYAEVRSPSESDQDEQYSEAPESPAVTESGHDADYTDEEIKKSSEKSEKSTDDNLPSAVSGLVESGSNVNGGPRRDIAVAPAVRRVTLRIKLRKQSPPKPEPESESSSGSSMDDFVVDDNVEISDGELTESSEEDGSDDGSNFSDEGSACDDGSTDSSGDGSSGDGSSDCQQVEVKQTRLRTKGGKSGSVKPDSDGDFASEKYPRSVTKQKRSQEAGSRTRSFSFSSDDDDVSPKPRQQSSKQLDIHGHKKDGGYKFSSDSEDRSPAVPHKPSRDLRNTAEAFSSDDNDTSQKPRQPSSEQLQKDGSFMFSSDSEDTSPKSGQPSSKQLEIHSHKKDSGYKFSSDSEDTSPESGQPSSKQLEIHSHKKDSGYKFSSDSEDTSPESGQPSSKQLEIHSHKKDSGYKFSSDSEDTSPESGQPSSKQLEIHSRKKDSGYKFSSDSEDTSPKSGQPSSKQLEEIHSHKKDSGYKFSSDDEGTSPTVTHKPSRDLAHTAENVSSDEENYVPRLTKENSTKNSKSSKTDKDGDNSCDITPTIKLSKPGGKKTTSKNKTKSPKTKLISRSWSLSSDDENVPIPESKSLTTGINITPDKKLKNKNPSESNSFFQSSDEEDASQSSVFRTQKPWEQNRKTSDFKTPKTPKSSKIELSDSEDDLPDISRPILKEKVINFNKRSDSLPDELLFSKLPTPLPKGKISKFSTPQPTRRRSTCSFLASLSDNVDDRRRDPSAARFVTNFKKLKEELTQHLFTLYNQTVFEGKLPTDTPVVWNKRLLKTAGYCYYKKGGAHSVNRTVRIELSVKVCDSAERTRDTLIHEMCHATVWLVNGVDKGGHGPYWQFWARQANHVHPELPIIARCHNYSINTKFTYKCTRCGYSIGRHSKSLDTERKVCGYCQGTFELLYNSGATPGRSSHSSTPTTPRTPNQFAMFVKEHYSVVKKRDKQLTHRDVMQELSKQFADLKHS